MPATTGRSRGRQGVRSGAQGAVGEHLSKIMLTLITGVSVIVFVLAMTSQGHVIDAATQRFMLFYAGVFALIGLSASVAVGLVATDRIIMAPGHRVMAQAVHRAVSLGAVAFLIIHIVSEILAQRVHVIDSVVPFLSPYRTFYIGLGTIASDLILLIIVTSVFRKRFTARGNAWRWRAIHYGAYAAFVLGVMHGLLGGRAAKPYVDWSYGFAIALTALALAVRFLIISLRPAERASAPRGPGRPGHPAAPSRSAGPAWLRAATAGTGPRPALSGGPGTPLGLPSGPPVAALPAARSWPPVSGPQPVLGATAAYVSGSSASGAWPAPDPLGAPVGGVAGAAGPGRYPFPMPGPALPPAGAGAAGPPGRQIWHEPGYDGPPRFVGAPRHHVPQDELTSYPYHRAGPQPGQAGYGTGPMPRLGPDPRSASGPEPRAGGGPMPALRRGPSPSGGTGPMPRVDTGPLPRVDTGPMPRADTGPLPWMGTGRTPRAGTGPMPRADTGPLPRVDTGPLPRAGTGPMPRVDTGPLPRAGTGPMPRVDTGPLPRADTGPWPRVDSGPMPQAGPEPVPYAGRRPGPPAGNGPASWPGSNPAAHHPAGPGARPVPAAAPRRPHAEESGHPRTRRAHGWPGGDEWR